jgi:hypothetical protein
MQSWRRDAALRVENAIHLRTLPGAAMVVGHNRGSGQ